MDTFTPSTEVHSPPDTTPGARWEWSYLDVPWAQARNGRELGSFLLGHLFGRGMHGETGLRVRIPEDKLAGVASVMLANGVTSASHTFGDGSVVIDIWCETAA